ncbi:GGDEF domain-containing protein [Rhizobium sp. KVB221]|uniref:diguanylate cyclase n=1 Tax=Rhizobium setariae TaxID=2801340 RepID=A0A936YPS5_9HYPH|nr:GGDEF domain-containing protein [Rhizobium setariae]MBL0374473.1 GGDEF domain-containing protein [Rhizobium setariae]
MITLLQNWIIRKIETGAFSKRRDVFWFAVPRTILTTLFAVGLNFAVYQVMGRLGFLNVTLPPDPLSDIIVTAFVAGPICFISYLIFGSAIYDLSVSRTSFEVLSHRDPLTGLLNRRAFEARMSAMEAPYALVLIDIDWFKNINDTHGHGTGDEILVVIADMLRDEFGADAVARLGGEEFAVILAGAGKVVAGSRMNAMRQYLAARVFRSGGDEVKVTFSAGIAQGDGRSTYSALLSSADKALYLAKASGRNRIVHADDALQISRDIGKTGGRRAI